MFNRSRSAADRPAEPGDDPDTAVEGPDSPTEGTAAAGVSAADAVSPAEVEELLSRLDAVASGGPEDQVGGLERLSEEVAEHAESLRASTRAQREAQRLLGVAARERAHVSAEVSAMLAGARELTDRLRAEAQDHADQERQRTRRRAEKERAAIEEVVTDLRATAERDAQQFATQAKKDAMAEARRTAKEHVRKATEVGVRDAEAHREQARLLLERSGETISAAAETLNELVEGATRNLAALGSQLDDLRVLVDETSRGVAKADEAAPIEVEIAPEASPDDDRPDQDAATVSTEATGDAESDTGRAPGADGSAPRADRTAAAAARPAAAAASGPAAPTARKRTSATARKGGAKGSRKPLGSRFTDEEAR